eukprot:9485813-Pyramimonas_sp.AAC.1
MRGGGRAAAAGGEGNVGRCLFKTRTQRHRMASLLLSSSSFSSSSSSTSRRRLTQRLAACLQGAPSLRRSPCATLCGPRLQPMQQLDQATAMHLQQGLCDCLYCGAAGHTTSLRGCPHLFGQRLLYRAMPRAQADQLQ